MSLLDKWLESRKLSYDELTESEKQDYHKFATALTLPDVTMEQLKKFLPVQIEQLEKQLEDYGNSKDKDLYLKACLRNLRLIHSFITAPEATRKRAEEHIKQQINH